MFVRLRSTGNAAESVGRPREWPMFTNVVANLKMRYGHQILEKRKKTRFITILIIQHDISWGPWGQY